MSARNLQQAYFHQAYFHQDFFHQVYLRTFAFFSRLSLFFVCSWLHLPRIVLVLTLTLFTSSCSIIFGSDEEELLEPDSASVEPTKEVRSKISSPKDKVEVLWEISKTPVDGFVIEYQIEGEKRKRQIEVATKELERFDDSTHGYVYRYLIPDVPANKRITVRLTAFEGDQLSQPSEAFEVLPRQAAPRRYNNDS